VAQPPQHTIHAMRERMPPAVPLCSFWFPAIFHIQGRNGGSRLSQPVWQNVACARPVVQCRRLLRLVSVTAITCYAR